MTITEEDELFIALYDVLDPRIGDDAARAMAADALIEREGKRILAEAEASEFPGLTQCVEIAALVPEVEELCRALLEAEKAVLQ